jgi:iron complex outermembrane receptor protein
MTSITSRRAVWQGLSVLIAGMAFSAGASAQGASRIEIEEILVTAEKRETALQDTPLAVTAISQEDMDSQNIIFLRDLTDKIPGLTVNPNDGSGLVVTVRGIGFEANQNQQSTPGVALHVDGIFLPQPGSANVALLDVERVEVLRGPQGTVFGQNSTGGVLNIVSRRPVLGEEFGGKVDLTLGNEDTIRPRVVLNAPIGETAALRVAGEYYTHEGYSEIVNTPLDGFELDVKDDLYGRVSLLWQPVEDFSIVVRAQHYTFDGHDAAQRHLDDPSGDAREVTHDLPAFFDIDETIVSGELTWELPWATLKSLTGWSDTKRTFQRDNDAGTSGFITDRPQVLLFSHRKGDSFTEEFNISSNMEGPIEWLAGIFYMDADQVGGAEEYNDFNRDGRFETTDAQPPPVGPFLGCCGLPDELSFQSIAPGDREAFSVYANLTWSITDRLRLLGGIRYNDEEQITDVTTYFGAFGTNVFEVTMNKVTWKAGVQYDFSEDIMSYFTASTGVKLGGVNLRQAQILPGNTLIEHTYDNEEVLAFEVGVKSRFYDQRFEANLAGFFYTYDDFQFHSENIAPFLGGVANAPEIEIYGAELEFSGLLTEALRWDLNATWLEGEVTKSKLALSPFQAAEANAATFAAGSFLFSPLNFALRAAAVRDLEGNDPAKLPSLSFNTSLTYEHNFPELGVLTSMISYLFKGAYEYSVYSDPGLGNPEYDQINLYFHFRPQNYPQWTAEFTVQNLEDDDSVVSRWTNAFGTAQIVDQFVPPRLFLFRVGYEF